MRFRRWGRMCVCFKCIESGQNKELLLRIILVFTDMGICSLARSLFLKVHWSDQNRAVRLPPLHLWKKIYIAQCSVYNKNPHNPSVSVGARVHRGPTTNSRQSNQSAVESWFIVSSLANSRSVIRWRIGSVSLRPDRGKWIRDMNQQQGNQFKWYICQLFCCITIIMNFCTATTINPTFKAVAPQAGEGSFDSRKSIKSLRNGQVILFSTGWFD